MTVEERESANAPDAARTRYTRSLRPSRIAYAVTIALVLVVVGAVVLVAWNHGEITHTRSHTVPTAPAAQPAARPADTVTLTWHSDDASALGDPVVGGTVVTWSTHTVRGRDVSTGRPTWSYTRSDRTVCQVVQSSGVAIAFFRLHGNCDEVTAVDAQTGVRRWTRTLDKDGHPVNGTPQFSIAAYTVLITTPQVIYAIDPSGGLDRWTFAQTGCTIRSAVVGSVGALISQSCANPDCTELTYCAAGDQLLLRDATANHSDEDKDKANPDRIKWLRKGDSSMPASADGVVSAVDAAANRLDVLDVTKGARLSSLALSGAPAVAGAISQTSTARAEVLWIGGRTYALELTGTAFFWSTATSGPPTVTGAPGTDTAAVDLTDATVLAPIADGVAALDGGTGRPTHVYRLGRPPTGAIAQPVGDGFVLAGSQTAVYG